MGQTMVTLKTGTLCLFPLTGVPDEDQSLYNLDFCPLHGVIGMMTNFEIPFYNVLVLLRFPKKTLFL